MVKVPKSINATTGDQNAIQKTLDSFFMKTKDIAKGVYNCQDRYFSIKSGNIAYDSRGQVSDDRITCLLYMDKIIAHVLETRTEFNNVRYDFFRNFRVLG